MADRDWALREHIHHLRRLQKEILDRVRSLRYFKAVRIVQDPASVVKCASDGSVVALENRALLSCCGHQGHKDVLRSFAGNNACPAAGCTAPVRPKSVVLASDLGASTADASSKAGSHGSKLGKLCTMLKTLPQDERVLVFVQFGDLMEKVKLAIEDLAGLKTSSLKGSSSQKTKVLTAFQACDDDVSSSDSKNDVRVLLLNLADESASGANLTTANHLVFVHPLYAESQQKWAQQEAQAVGRVRRYGQKREVKVHRFIVDDSIDSEILDSMERDYIGPVVHIHASVSSMSEEFEAAVRTACAANPGLRELTYPISGDYRSEREIGEVP
jgi:SNF2 family DNA or RNA helicase